MSAFVMTLTQAGLSAVVNVQAGDIGPISITEIGLSDQHFTVSSTLEALPGEFKRLPIGGDVLGDDLIHVTALDASADAYSYRAFALYTSANVLFAVYGQADWIAQKTPATSSYFALDVAMASGQAATLVLGDTNFVNPPATTERQGVVELATAEEAAGGTDPLRALTPAAMQAALLTMLLRVDGAGTDINADLLDGQHGAWYADILSRLGYVPFDSVGFTGPAILTLLKTVDGAGSGADADLLDGQHGAWYADIVSRLGYVPFDSTGFTGPAILTLLKTVDGAGSGADADLLDGQDGAWYADIAARLGYVPQNAAASTTGSNANGYWEKRPNGMIEQWGTATALDPWSGDLAFPIPFSDLASVNLQVTSSASNNGAFDGNKVNGRLIDVSTFQLGSDDGPSPVFWRAIGKYA